MTCWPHYLMHPRRPLVFLGTLLADGKLAYQEIFTETVIGYKYWRRKKMGSLASVSFCRTEVKQNKKRVRILLAPRQKNPITAGRSSSPSTSAPSIPCHVSCNASFLPFRSLTAHMKTDNICGIYCFLGKP